MGSRRTLLRASLAALACGALPAAGEAAADASGPAPSAAPAPLAPSALPRLPRLVLAGPPASVSNPLVRIAETGMLADVAEKVEFVLWKDPDRLRALALQGGADVLAMPVNVAANLHNRGADIRLLDVSAWGILWIVTRNAKAARLADLRDSELAVPFRGDMPDIVLQLIAEKQGLDLRNTVRLRYVASPLDALQLLLMRRVDSALLAEPAASMALRKSGSFPLSVVAPELHRGIDLQREWGLAFGREPRIPQAGIAVTGSLRDRPEVIARVAHACRKALEDCQAAPADCGREVARRIDMLDADAIADAMATSKMRSQPAADARSELEFLFRQLMQRNPALIGGRLPPDAFYLDASGRPAARGTR